MFSTTIIVLLLAVALYLLIAGFSCWPGSGSAVVIPSATK